MAGWDLDAHGAVGSATIDEKVSHGGKRSLCLTNATPLAPNIFYRVSRSITAQPFTTYRISCWVKGEQVGSGEFIGGGPGWAVRLVFPEGTYDWKEISMEWSTGATAEDFELMLLTQSPTKKVWVDDVSFVAIKTDEVKLAELRKSLDATVAKEMAHLASVIDLAKSRALDQDAEVTLGASIAQRFIDRITRMGLEQNMSWSTMQIEEVETVLNQTQMRIEQQPVKLPGTPTGPARKVEIDQGIFRALRRQRRRRVRRNHRRLISADTGILVGFY